MGSEVSSGLFYFHSFSPFFSITASLVGAPTKVAYGALLLHARPGPCFYLQGSGRAVHAHVPDREAKQFGSSPLWGVAVLAQAWKMVLSHRRKFTQFHSDDGGVSDDSDVKF